MTDMTPSERAAWMAGRDAAAKVVAGAIAAVRLVDPSAALPFSVLAGKIADLPPPDAATADDLTYVVVTPADCAPAPKVYKPGEVISPNLDPVTAANAWLQSLSTESCNADSPTCAPPPA
jgi:hypothetical protein